MTTDIPEPIIRCAVRIALAVGCLMLPWSVTLGFVLPAAERVSNWRLAWAGLDGAEGLATLATATLLTRADRRASLTAVAAATLFVTDAWWDLCTSAPGSGRALAVAEAVFAELPLAGGAIWLATVLIRSTS